MASNTEHYNLVKPDYTDAADVAQLNGNMDIIDNLIWQLANADGDEEILALLRQIIATVGETADTDGDTISGSVMAKLNAILVKNTSLIDYMPLLNSTIGTDNPVPLDTIILQAVVGNVFEYTTAGTYILQIPATVTKIKVTACGAGGGGGGSNDGGGGGGGGEAIVEQEYSVTPQSQLSITIGAGGAGGSDNAAGKAGGSTVIGSLVTLRGGNGGSVASQGNAQGAVAVGNGGAGGNSKYVPRRTEITTPSGDGTNGLIGSGGSGVLPVGNTTGTYASAACAGGGGGGSIGNGGNGQTGNGGGTTPTKGGGGGGGGRGYIASQNRTADGIDGAPGYAKIEWGYK
ncbi:glycine-rich domain-containing protein [Anaerotignum sp. MSJ-24]|uniref:glycine-rich domain-containing protein n=1 Tax=Anaerotignum sp. MSJ-24 TaxID=2841521 RepID=UPI001C10610D|nr:hypothetical protein [Anaerotignum sp. MSJ-24]MBU5464979.1 hypothetical protein [Anaerotignum sp. MSJ-24]